MPSQTVLRIDAEKTKVLLAVDTSCKDGRTGISLNDLLYIGLSLDTFLV